MEPSRIRIEIAPDRMEARVHVVSGDPCAPDTLGELLSAASVLRGIDQDAVARIAVGLASAEFATCELVASGTPMEPGQDARLEPCFEDALAPGGEREDGSFDWTERSLLHPVQQEDRIATLHRPGSGKPGLGVDGEEIPAEAGGELSTVLGDGVVLGDDDAVRSTIAGVIHHQPGRLLEVVDHHVHAADVDLRSGNLAVKGSLSISGDVALNMRVACDHDLEIKGGVDGGRLTAGGSVRVARGLIGRERGRIAAEADVTLNHVQNAKILCGGTLSVAADSLGSRLQASAIELGGRALGGELLAETRISVRQAGSPMGAPTRLRAAEPVSRPLAAAVASLAEQKAVRTSRQRDAGRKARGAAGRRGRMKRTATLKRTQELAKRRRALLEKATIEIREQVLDGVSLRFSTHRLEVAGGMGPSRFRYDAATDCITREDLE